MKDKKTGANTQGVSEGVTVTFREEKDAFPLVRAKGLEGAQACSRHSYLSDEQVPLPRLAHKKLRQWTLSLLL